VSITSGPVSSLFCMTMEVQAIYEHTDIPAGMTCAEYRRKRHAEHRPTRLARLIGRLRHR
jgi:hypothetical protein